MEEHASGTRIGAFPTHWRGILPGQSTEERAAVIVENAACDAEARGDNAAAVDIRTAWATTTNAEVLLERAHRLANR